MNHNHHAPLRRSFAVVLFLISASVLTFEITLTRIFSIILSYHYTFAAISVALLGLGLGAASLPRWQRITVSSEITSTCLMVLTLAGSISVMLLLPVHENELLARLRFWIYLPVATFPFFFAGLTIASLFQRFPENSSQLYAADLLGAALGVLVVVPLLNRFGGVKATLVPVVVTFLAVLILQKDHHLRSRPVLSRIALMVLAILGLYVLIAKFEVPVASDPDKEMYQMLHNKKHPAEIVETRWSAFGRTDLVQSKTELNEKVLFVDGGAGTSMYQLEVEKGEARLRTDFRTRFGGYFPFFFLKPNEKNNALIIGPGGGRDVLVALLGDVQSISAVEVNPQFVEIVKDYEEFNGGIYTRFPGVEVVVAEGRNYLRSSNVRYDLIMLALPLTKSSRSVEGYVMTENYLFTVEAMQDYLDHLTPEGRLVLVVHDAAEIFRLVVLATQAFRKYGVETADVMKHLYVLGSGMMPTVVIKKEPFTEKEIQQRHPRIHKLRFDQGHLFIPYTQQIIAHTGDQTESHKMVRMLDPTLLEISKGELSIEALIKKANLDISPVTDDRPFFYKFERGIPEVLTILSSLTSLVLLGLISPFPRHIKALKEPLRLVRVSWIPPELKPFLLVCAGLGIGFMLLEIALFQRLMLFLGQPQWALSILLFSLLIGTGFGGLCSSLIRQRLARSITVSSLVVAVLASIETYYLADLLGTGVSARLTAPLLILPLGFALGFPFPLVLRLLAQRRQQKFVHRMWAINSVASVLGSTLAMILGITLGFSYALYTGAVIYAGIALLASMLPRLVSKREGDASPALFPYDLGEG